MMPMPMMEPYCACFLIICSFFGLSAIPMACLDQRGFNVEMFKVFGLQFLLYFMGSIFSYPTGGLSKVLILFVWIWGMVLACRVYSVNAARVRGNYSKA